MSPIAPPEPKRAPPRPKTPDRLPEPLPQPTRKPSAPDPFPERRTPLKPSVNPQDLVPFELYELDRSVDGVWQKFPPYLRQIMKDGAEKRKSDLHSQVRAYKPFYRRNLAYILQELPKLEEKIQKIESQHRDALTDLIHQMVTEKFEPEIAGRINLSLSRQLPDANTEMTPEDSDDETNIRPLSRKEMEFFVYRRELYKLLNQAHGWIGMETLIDAKRSELESIDPDLATLYRQMHTFHRYLSAKFIEDLRDLSLLQSKEFSRSAPGGRQITTIEGKKFEDETGDSFIETTNSEATAVAHNAWILSHEAFKAAFMLATRLEATQRMGLTRAEDEFLEGRTNSTIAEVRQLAFGQDVEAYWRSALDKLKETDSGRKLTPLEYFQATEKIFILRQNAFEAVIQQIFDQNFLINIESQRQTLKRLREHDIF